MPSKEKNFDDQERVLWEGGFSAKSMLSAVLGSALITGMLVIAVVRIQTLNENRLVWWTLAAIIGAIWLGLICIVLYRKLAQHYEMTNQRLKHRRGLLIRQIDRIELIDIDDVSYRQGPIESLMGVGTIKLLSSDTSHPTLVMPGIANVSEVANLIDDSRRDERLKHGLHIESI